MAGRSTSNRHDGTGIAGVLRSRVEFLRKQMDSWPQSFALCLHALNRELPFRRTW